MEIIKYFENPKLIKSIIYIVSVHPLNRTCRFAIGGTGSLKSVRRAENYIRPEDPRLPSYLRFSGSKPIREVIQLLKREKKLLLVPKLIVTKYFDSNTSVGIIFIEI